MGKNHDTDAVTRTEMAAAAPRRSWTEEDGRKLMDGLEAPLASPPYIYLPASERIAAIKDRIKQVEGERFGHEIMLLELVAAHEDSSIVADQIEGHEKSLAMCNRRIKSLVGLLGELEGSRS